VRLIATIALLVGSVTANAEIVAFIGNPISVRVNPNKCSFYLPQDEPGVTAICMDRVFDLEYSVDELLSGSIEGASAKFIGFYHYGGMPAYSMYPDALVVLSKGPIHTVACTIKPVEERSDRLWVCDEWPDDEAQECTVGRFVEQVIEDCANAT
jgi:hypothetical protein